MTAYRLFPSTNGPSAGTSYTGNFIAGMGFTITAQVWLFGHWVWCCSTGQSTSPVKCAIWSKTSASTGAVIPAATATSGTLTPGAWNYVGLTTPVPLSIGDTLMAAQGINGNFAYGANQFAGGGPYINGITNGPLTAFSAPGGGGIIDHWTSDQGLFSTAGSDPATTLPITGDSGVGHSNFWCDVDIRDTTPPGYNGNYRLWPNMTGACGPNTVLDTGNTFTLGVEFTLSTACSVLNLWFYSPASATELPTALTIWNIGSPATGGTLRVTNTSPAWVGAAGSGWIHAPWSISLPAGTYKASVYNGNSSPNPWNGAYGDFWAGGANAYASPGLNGISGFGPISAPNVASAHIANQYQPSSPWYDATTMNAQSTFNQPTTTGGADAYPHIYVDTVSGSGVYAYNYWVDLEVQVATLTSTVTVALGPLTLTATGNVQGSVTATCTVSLGPIILNATPLWTAPSTVALGPITLTVLTNFPSQSFVHLGPITTVAIPAPITGGGSFTRSQVASTFPALS